MDRKFHSEAQWTHRSDVPRERGSSVSSESNDSAVSHFGACKVDRIRRIARCPDLASGTDLELAESFSMAANFERPPVTLLEDPDPFPHEQHDSHLRDQAGTREKTFADLNLNIKVVGIHTGPVITQYEVAP